MKHHENGGTVQKCPLSHPPNPGGLGRTFPQAKPQYGFPRPEERNRCGEAERTGKYVSTTKGRERSWRTLRLREGMLFQHSQIGILLRGGNP